MLPHGQRVVLGLLAVSAGSPVWFDAIADLLWGESPPASAVGIVQTYVSRLRLVLGAGVLLREAAGYRLQVTEDELDLLAFRKAVRDARSAAEPEAACASYARAFALWRGEPLPDVDVLRDHPAVIALADEFADVVLEYADVAARCGMDEQVLPHLRALVTRRELDEPTWARLMIALAGTGRQAEALAVFKDVRHRLDEELGIPPGPGLREAHARVLRQGAASAMIAAGDWPPLFQMPAAPADFTGRETEVARLSAALLPGDVGVPIALVSGQPGVGKTSLALNAAHRLRARFPEGQLWVDLGGTSPRPRDPAEVLGEFLRGLGMLGSAIPESLSERTVCYRSRMAGRRILVVADDAASVAQIRPLLPGTAGCALLVTSRLLLEDMDGAELIPLDVMSGPDAAALLTRLVGEDRMAAERDAAASLIQFCGALPLALRITGAKLAARPLWSLSLMARKMNGLSQLESGDLSVRASIDSSYVSLSERASLAFRLLALAGPADFAEWVVDALLGEPDASDVLAELTSRSLVTPLGADPTGEARYRLHDLLRDYAAERLTDDPVPGRVQDRLLSAWLQLAMQADAKLPAEPYSPPPPAGPLPQIVPGHIAERLTADPVAWFATERLNLLGAVERACQAGLLDLGQRLAAHQCAYQYLHFRHDDAERSWRTIGIRAKQDGDRAAVSHAAVRVAASLVQRGRSADALPVLDQCVNCARADMDLKALAYALEWRATCVGDVEDYAGACRDADQAVGLARQLGSLLAEQRNLCTICVAAANVGERRRAIEAGQRSLEIAVNLRMPSYELAALHSLGHACYLVGEHAHAVTYLTRAVELGLVVGDASGEALAYGMLGDAYSGLDRHEDAMRCYLHALPMFRDQSTRFYAVCLLKLGRVHQAMGSTSEAIDCLKKSLRIFTSLRLPAKAELARQALASCAAGQR